MDTQNLTPQPTPRETREALNKRLETIGWGLFLVMIGGLALVPDRLVPDGTWLLGVGLIFLGLNLARYRNGIAISGFTTVLGIVAVVSGLGDMLGADLPVWPILLIVIGAGIVLRPMLERSRDQDDAGPHQDDAGPR